MQIHFHSLSWKPWPPGASDDNVIPFHSQSLGDSQHEQRLRRLVQHCQEQTIPLHYYVEGHPDKFRTLDDHNPEKELVILSSSEFKAWLVDALADFTTPFNAYLEATQKEAENASPARFHEILLLRRDIFSILEIPNNESPQKLLKRRSRKTRQENLLNSSESSGQESNTKTRSHRKAAMQRHRTKQQKQVAARPAIIPPSSILLWLSPLRIGFATLLKLGETLPLEIRVLKQLSFESVNSREDSIREAESGTFQWLLDDAVDTDLTQNMGLAKNSFISWLNCGSGVFHISGNAGSGKSTLMKLLRHHQRTRSELELWAANGKLVFSGFYFWNSGSSIQMSLEGLYRSILLEVSRQCPKLIPVLFPDCWALLTSVLEEQSPEIGFSDPERIQKAFEVLRSLGDDSEYRMCFFIDGLDEFTGQNIDYWTLAKNLKNWSQSSGVKLCVSARPYPEFLSTFSSELRFHLHELTSRDLEAFASDSFRSTAKLELPQKDLDALIQLVLRGSQGVFLWARVVIRSLLSLANRGSSIPQLLEVARNYPSDINELYDFLLGSLEPQEIERSSQMLSVVVGNPFSQPLNALCFSWIDELDEWNFSNFNSPYSSGEVRERHKAVRSQVEWLTKGLLEMHTNKRERKEGDQFYRQRVQFFHRTARDYLRSPSRRVPASPTETYAKLRLAEIVLAGKCRVTSGADPRRRRLYSNLLRSLFNLRHQSGKRFPVPHLIMRILELDLKVTVTDSRFSGPYAVSGLKSISDHNITDEDPEKEASFVHFAISYGQQEYAMKEVAEKYQILNSNRKLNILISAAFGHHQWPSVLFASLLPYSPPPTTKIKLQHSLADDPLASSPLEVSVLMVFVSAVVYRCFGSRPQRENRNNKSLEYEEYQELFVLLALILEFTAETKVEGEDIYSNVTPSLKDFVCILHKTEMVDGNGEEPVFFTTLSQLAIRFSPTYKDSMVHLRDNTVRQDITQPNDTRYQDHLPAWIAGRLRNELLGNEARFVPHFLLGDYTCSQVITETESIIAADNLFFRIY